MQIKLNLKAFYDYIRRFRQVKSNVGPLKKGKHYYSGPKAMAEILSAQYESAFSYILDHYDHDHIRESSCPPLTDITFSVEDIMDVIKDMQEDAAPGPDGIPAFLFKTYAAELAPPLHYIWRISLDKGKMPEGVSVGIITPIFKGGNRSAPKDYRPVSLTNHTTKIFERVLRKALVDHLESNNLLHEAQHGFRKGRSCITQILKYYDSILTLLEEGQSVDAVYLDFAKAFDKVDHQILLKKLESVQVGGKVLQWIREFLTNREQRVRIEKTLSNSKKVRSGVPQGSVLGPLLFLIMIIDIDHDTLEALMGIFADDTRLWRVHTGEEDVNLLQNELDKTYKWAESNNASFNSDKFEAIRFHTSRSKAHPNPSYNSYNGTPIPFQPHVKDLGVWMSANLTFSEHIRLITTKARQVSGMTLRSFTSRKTEVLLPLLKNIIRNQVEYASPIWSPTDYVSINLLEDVQRKFTSKFTRFREYDADLGMTICTTPYPSRLKLLKLSSLQRRRDRYTIIYMFKIKCGAVPNPGFTPTYHPRTKAFSWKPRYDRKNGRNSFYCMGPRLFNSIPATLRGLDDKKDEGKTIIETFKKDLDEYLKTVPDNPGSHNNSLVNICMKKGSHHSST